MGAWTGRIWDDSPCTGWIERPGTGSDPRTGGATRLAWRARSLDRQRSGPLMSLEHYVTLGRSGLRVFPSCLGCMTFGDNM